MLFDALRRVAPEEVGAVLEEYAWHSLLSDERARTWCEDVKDVLNQLQIELPSEFLSASQVSQLLYPFLVGPQSTTNTHFGLITPTHLLPISILCMVSKKQFIDSLVTLSKARTLLSKVEGIEKSVVELCLEYTGRTWREAIASGTEHSLVDELARDLVEVEFEIQCQGDHNSLRTKILPVLRDFRFQLGFTTSQQLLTKLNTRDPFDLKKSDVEGIINAWITRRLNTGLESSRIWSTLNHLKSKLRHPPAREAISSQLQAMGLKRSLPQIKLDSPESETEPLSSPMTASISSPLITTPKRSGWSFFNHNTNNSIKKDEAPIKSPSTSAWFTRRRSGSVLQKSLFPPNFDPEYRRPSLPTISFTPLPPASPLRVHCEVPMTPATTASTGSRSTLDLGLPVTPSTPINQSNKIPDLSSLLESSDLEETCTILGDHLRDMRYRIRRPEGTWYLGGGKATAVEFLNTLEARLQIKHDPQNVKTVLGKIRILYLLPGMKDPIISYWTSIIPPAPLIVPENIPIVPRQREPSAESTNTTISSVSRATSPYSIGSRNASFDLDRYIRDIMEEEEKESHKESEIEEMKDIVHDSPSSKSGRRRGSGSANSILSFTSRRRFTRTSITPPSSSRGRETERSSFMSNYNFSIKEARKAYPFQAVAIDKGLTIDPPPSSSSSTSISNYKSGFDDTQSKGNGNKGGSPYKGGSLTATKSTPNLLIDKFTSLPPRLGIYGRSRSRLGKLPESASAIFLPLREEEESVSVSPMSTVKPRVSIQSDPIAEEVGPNTEITPSIQDSGTGSGSDTASEKTFGPLTPSASVSDFPSEGETETSRARRQWNRQCAIVDRVQMSPTKSTHGLFAPGLDSAPSPFTAPVTPSEEMSQLLFTTPPPPTDVPLLNASAKMKKSQGGRVVVPPRQSSLTPTPTVSLTPTPAPAPEIIETSPRSAPPTNPLEAVLALFAPTETIKYFQNQLLSLPVVEEAIERFVSLERDRCEDGGLEWDDGGKKRVIWVLEQVENMMPDPAFKYPVHRAIRQLTLSTTPSPSHSLAFDASVVDGTTVTPPRTTMPAVETRKRTSSDTLVSTSPQTPQSFETYNTFGPYRSDVVV